MSKFMLASLVQILKIYSVILNQNAKEGVIMNREELVKTARLARLKLSEKEEVEFASQLEMVFEYFNHISSIDTQGVEPLIYPLDGMDTSVSIREDQTQKVQNKEELLNLAPQRLGDEYKVPPVVE